MTINDIREIRTYIQYKNWWFAVGSAGELGNWIQWRFFAPDSDSGETKIQHCRKWLVSSHATRSEVIQTAFKAALSAEEHECRELFKYCGESVFAPHFDVHELAIGIQNNVIKQDARK